MRKRIYNLEFPSWCPEMTIFGYRFRRADDYPEKVSQLQHLVSITSEFQITANSGQHAITAYVDIPAKEKKAVFEWMSTKATALTDILLLLSLFTQRDVFAVDNYDPDGGGVIVADPREYGWGGILRTSIPYKKQPIGPEPYSYNIGFEETLNQIYQLIRTPEWQLKYQTGYFLILAKQAFHRQSLETTFIQCWTIWEHLFTLHNQNWLSDNQILKLNSSEKIAFLLVEYALKPEIDESSGKKIASLAKIRNRLVHFGRFPPASSVFDDAELFIRLTEFIIAKILGLLPSEIFDTTKKLEEFLKRRSTHN